jgi:hypothetical protein
LPVVEGAVAAPEGGGFEPGSSATLGFVEGAALGEELGAALGEAALEPAVARELGEGCGTASTCGASDPRAGGARGRAVSGASTELLGSAELCVGVLLFRGNEEPAPTPATRTTPAAAAASTIAMGFRGEPFTAAVVAMPPAVTWACIEPGSIDDGWPAAGSGNARAGSSGDKGARARGIVPASSVSMGGAITPRLPGVEGLNEGEDAGGFKACDSISGIEGMLEARPGPSATPSASARAAIADVAVGKRACGEAAVTFANQASNVGGSGTPRRIARAVAGS